MNMTLDRDQAERLVKLAEDAAVAQGIDSVEAFERMVEGAGRYREIGMQMFLDAMMLLAEFEPNDWMKEAYLQFAEHAGDLPLTEQERQIAIVNYVIGGGFLEQWPYEWYWRKRLPERKGQPCRVVTRGKMNSISVEFPDGFRVVTSGFAIRKREGK